MTNTFLAVYRPNLKTKSDADILRDAKLEAMGLPPEDHEHRPHYERPQMATDEMVNDLNLFHVNIVVLIVFVPGHGALQEADA